MTRISPRHTLPPCTHTTVGRTLLSLALMEASAFRRLLSCRALLTAPLPGNLDSV